MNFFNVNSLCSFIHLFAWTEKARRFLGIIETLRHTHWQQKAVMILNWNLVCQVD